MLRVDDLQAHFRTHYFGVNRDVKAVDGITFDVRRSEIYGLAGESSSGKTTLIKTIAGAVKPPLRGRGRQRVLRFLPGYGGLHLAPAAEVGADPLAAPLLHHARLDERAESAAAGSAQPSSISPGGTSAAAGRNSRRAVVAHLARVKLDPSVLTAYPHELSGGMRQRVDDRARDDLQAGIHHRRRADDRARRRRPEGRARDDPRRSSAKWDPRSCSSHTTWASTRI